MIYFSCKGGCHLGQFKLLEVVVCLEGDQEVKGGQLLHLVQEAVHGLESESLFHWFLVLIFMFYK